MNPVSPESVSVYVETHISLFHNARLNSLETLSLTSLLQRKNPYLFKAKHLEVAHDLITTFLDAHLSSSEEGLFGQFLDQLAIYIVSQTAQGQRSERTGIDLEFENGVYYNLVQVKSGPNWGNNDQKRRLKQNFVEAKLEAQAELGASHQVRCVLGIAYGKTRTVHNEVYTQVTGQNFWYFLSHNPDLYTDVIEPIGTKAAGFNADFATGKAHVVNRLTREFTERFCDNSGAINWAALVAFNSGNWNEMESLF